MPKTTNITEKNKVRESPGQTTVTSFSWTLHVLFRNIPEGALKPSSCLQQLTATSRQKDGSGGQGQQRTKKSNAVVMYLGKEGPLIVMAMLNI